MWYSYDFVIRLALNSAGLYANRYAARRRVSIKYDLELSMLPHYISSINVSAFVMNGQPLNFEYAKRNQLQLA